MNLCSMEHVTKLLISELVIWNMSSDCLFQIAYFTACNMEHAILLCALWSSFGEITSEFYQLGE